MTQLSMLGNDKDGNYTYGDDEAVIVKDLQIETKGTPKVNETTTYSFVLKNNVKFSRGSFTKDEVSLPSFLFHDM